MIHFPRPSHFFPEVPLTLREVTPTCIPNDLVRIIEEYAEVESTHRLTEGLGNLQNRVFTYVLEFFHIPNYIPTNTLKALLGDRFKIINRAQFIISHLWNHFRLSILFRSTLWTSSWLLAEGIPQISISDAMKDPSKYANELMHLVDKCRRVEFISTSKLISHLSRLPDDKRTNQINANLRTFKEGRLNPETANAFNDCIKITEITKKLYELVDFIKFHSEAKEEYFVMIRKLIRENLNYIFYIPKTLLTWDHAIPYPIIEEIVVYLIKTDFAGCAYRLKGKIVRLISNTNILDYPFITNLSKATKIKVEDLAHVFPINIKNKENEELIHSITRKELYHLPKKITISEKSMWVEELKILKRLGASTSFISWTLVNGSFNLLHSIELLNEAGLHITPEIVIKSFEKSLKRIPHFYKMYLKLILLLIEQGAQLSTEERREIEKEISPVTAAESPPNNYLNKRYSDNNDWAKCDGELQSLIKEFRLKTRPLTRVLIEHEEHKEHKEQEYT